MAFPAAVLFDLDGTLIDSAPDLLAALDRVLDRHGLPASDHAALRHHASRGAGGILKAGLHGVEGIDTESLTDEFLGYYADNLWRDSRPFSGVETVLAELRHRGCRLAVVTNKHSRFALPVLHHAGWEKHFDCVVTGDSVDRPKPHAEPVMTACRQLGVVPGSTAFVGDDRRDVDAGQRAGAVTVVAAWGYISPEESVPGWGADLIVEQPADLVPALAGNERFAGIR